MFGLADSSQAKHRVTGRSAAGVQALVMTLDDFLSSLWRHYVSLTPSAGRIRDLLERRGDTWVHDHIAFRTYDNSAIGLEALEPHLLNFGYERFAPYAFEDKKIRAYGYLHPEPERPRIFLSELETAKLSESARSLIGELTAGIDPATVANPHVLNSGPLWALPSREVYEQLLQESEYAGWVAVNGLCANHFTVSVNHLKSFPSLEALLEFLQSEGFPMNTSGGLIKGTPEVLLEQGSTLADTQTLTLAGGVKTEVTTCYVEFARRYQGFNGFVPASADKIFESTDAKR